MYRSRGQRGLPPGGKTGVPACWHSGLVSSCHAGSIRLERGPTVLGRRQRPGRLRGPIRVPVRGLVQGNPRRALASLARAPIRLGCDPGVLRCRAFLSRVPDALRLQAGDLDESRAYQPARPATATPTSRDHLAKEPEPKYHQASPSSGRKTPKSVRLLWAERMEGATALDSNRSYQRRPRRSPFREPSDALSQLSRAD
jgi:hypothetical protein